jgi:hypothetical protein
LRLDDVLSLFSNGTHDGASIRSALHGGAVGRHDSQVEELIALKGDYRVARAAFDEAGKQPDHYAAAKDEAAG